MWFWCNFGMGIGVIWAWLCVVAVLCSLRFGMVAAWCWYGFGTVEVRLWHGCVMVSV